MKNKYELIINLDYKMKSVYKEYFLNEGYDVVAEEADLIFVRKKDHSMRQFKNEKEIIDFIINMAKKENFKGMVNINLDKEMNFLLEKFGNIEKLDFREKIISWQIREAFNKAILEKKIMEKEKMDEE